MSRTNCCPPASPRHGGHAGERGLSESLQWTLLAPLVVLVIVGAIEAALVLQARAVVAQAALAGAEAQAVAGSGDSGASGSADAAARAVARGAGLSRLQVSTTTSDAAVRVVVQAHVNLPIDLGFGAIQSAATVPVER